LHYQVSFKQAAMHLFDVKLTINQSLDSGQTFYLPSWIPGSYMIRDFAKNIINLRASCSGKNIELAQIDKASWKINQAVESLEISYQIYAWDLSVRSAHLDNLHGFFNGTSLFLAAKGLENKPHQVELRASNHAANYNWQVATAMPSIKVDKQGFGLYQSQNYAELIDHPFEIADLETIEFDVCGVPHKMVFTEAPSRVDWQRIADDVKQICETEVAFFGDDKPPFEQYVFMTFVQKKGFGGLEHIASTALHCSDADLPLLSDSVSESNSVSNSDSDSQLNNQAQAKKSVEYRGFLALCCHEYFHNWNVKRIKPAKFIPLDLSQEQSTELLWFFEGITSYYDELLMVRAGVVEPSDYLDMLAQGLTRVMRSTGRFKQSVAESSFNAWTKFYKQDENANNAIVSYYTKGALVALALDFEIKQLTNGSKTLDDLMRTIWNDFGKSETGINPDISNIGLGEKQVVELAEQLTGQSMKAFFDRVLYSCEEVNLTEIFDRVDIEYQLVAQQTSLDKGGYSEKPKQTATSYNKAFLGITHKAHAQGAEVVTVAETSCAVKAGLSNADIILAIDDRCVTSNELDTHIGAIPVGAEVKISYIRRQRLYHTQCILEPSVANTVYLSFKDGKPSEKATNWLSC
jgi:predicted metalloprotease with PDZ domain